MRQGAWVVAIGAVAGAFLLLLDYSLAFHDGVTVFYVGLVLIGLAAPSPRSVLALALAASSVVCVGYYLSVLSGVGSVSLEVRAITILMIWITALAIHGQVAASGDLRIELESLRNQALEQGSWAARSAETLRTEREDRKRAEDALADGVEQLRTIYEDAPLMIYVTDDEQRIIEVSNYWLTQLGYGRNEVIGRRIDEFVDPECRSGLLVNSTPNAGPQGATPSQFHCTFLKKDGGVMETLLSLTIEPNGGQVRVWGVVKDTTELNRVIHELHEHETLYHAVFNQTFQFIILLDPDGRVREANDTMLAFAGEPHRAIAGRTVWDLADWAGKPEAEAILRSAVDEARQGNFVRDEISIAGVAETSLTIEFSMKPVRDDDGNVEVLIFEGRDVTEQRLQQEMLVRSQKMEAIGALTSGVAHDFNNILTVIAGNLELLQKRTGGDEKVDSRFEKAIEAVFRGRSLTQQLLAFSREQHLRPTAVDVNTVIAGLREIFGTLGESVDIELDVAADLWPCWVDAVQLETVLLNILINTRDAMPDGGKVTISCKNVELGGTAAKTGHDLSPGDYVRIAVTDTGTGMPREVMEHAFDPFFTTKEPDQGTGLGLSMAFGFAKQSGGDITLYSEEGKGTTVRLYLPRSDEAVAVSSASDISRASDAPHSGRVLVVEDDNNVRDVAVSALRDAGYAVAEASDGDAAAELLRAGETFDLLFTDVELAGGQDGTDVASFALAIQPDIKVLYTSGYPRRPLSDSHSKIQGSEFLAKPYRQDELLSRVHRFIAGGG